LARDLAAAAAASPHSHWCVTVTDPDGIAVGHGCARPARTNKRTRKTAGGTGPALFGRTGRAYPMPHRANLPPAGNRASPPDRTPWALTPAGARGPHGGHGAWVLTLPGGRHLTLQLGPVPVTGCDHRHQSHAYQPGDTLRHLVEIRDGTCTFPPCSRHARHCD